METGIYNSAYVNFNLILRIWISNEANRYRVMCNPSYTTYRAEGNHQSDTDKVFTAVQKAPSFPGGMEGFAEYFDRNVKYPDHANQNHIQGVVYATFIVEKDGSLTNIFIVRSPDEEISMEALRILKMCPKFNPGMQNGNPVRVTYVMPLKFILKN
jgi:TonB family protein